MSFDPQQELIGFAGSAPLFPLPNVVHFPRVLLPVHIFEDRYRAMVRDALLGDRLIAMALLKPGYENKYYEKSAPIYGTVCLGKIVADEQLPDGRYNLALEGLTRAYLIEEEETDVPYRVGRLDLCDDHYPRDPAIDRANRRRELISGFREMLPRLEVDQAFHYALDADVPLGALCDILGYAMQLEPLVAQGILEECNVDLRSDLVLESLRTLSRNAGLAAQLKEFPPPFSAN